MGGVGEGNGNHPPAREQGVGKYKRRVIRSSPSVKGMGSGRSRPSLQVVQHSPVWLPRGLPMRIRGQRPRLRHTGMVIKVSTSDYGTGR